MTDEPTDTRMCVCGHRAYAHLDVGCMGITEYVKCTCDHFQEVRGRRPLWVPDVPTEELATLMAKGMYAAQPETGWAPYCAGVRRQRALPWGEASEEARALWPDRARAALSALTEGGQD